MPEETKPIPEGVEVAENVIKSGTVSFMNKTAVSNPAPQKMKRIIKALNYFCVGLMTAVGGSDLFSGGQAKIIVFIIGVFLLALGSLEFLTGVKPVEDKE